MSKINWLDITREDVIRAIEIFSAENSEHPLPRNTFLIYKDKKLPAKHIRGMAYKVAYGREISKSDFGGGMETVSFFERLGFEMIYIGQSEHSSTKPHIKQKQNKQPVKKSIKSEETKARLSENKLPGHKIKIPSKAVLEQKNALQLLLNKMFSGDIVCEKNFDWLKTPKTFNEEYENIYKALSEFRGDVNFARKNIQLRCDFVCESEKLIIEYDERQHYSEARKLSLMSYPDIPLYFDKNLWIQACIDINAKDNNPINRDERRAYYDSVRDIEASKNKYKLVRIMHGQIDFEGDLAEKQLRDLLDAELNRDAIINSDPSPSLKIGLYLQTDEVQNEKDFDNAMNLVKKSDIDILVLPEFSYVPFISLLRSSDIIHPKDLNTIFDLCVKLSKEIGKAVIVSSFDKYERIFSVFSNAFADENETECAMYVKHTMTYYSAFDFTDYKEVADFIFGGIIYKGYRIGMTICYDCNHSIFSRVYGLKDIDVIINSTGGDVVYDKWYKYNKARAIENSCYNFVTMSGDGNRSKPIAYVYGFNRNGKELIPTNLDKENNLYNSPGKIYIYDLGMDDGQAQEDTSLHQIKTKNKHCHLNIPVADVNSILNKAKKITNNIFISKTNEFNIVFCVVEGNDIVKPEKVLPLLYASELKPFKNKRYIIVNKHKFIDMDFFKTKLSVILKVRAMENFCAVILESDNINNCYQSGKNRTAQVIEPTEGIYCIDLSRTTGPEAIWKDKAGGMRASWRENFEWLIHEIDGNK